MQNRATRMRWTAISAATMVMVGIAAGADSTGAFFRIFGPGTSVITRIRSDGTLAWSNQVLNVTCHVQTATSLPGTGDWRDYAHVRATTDVTTATVFDLSTPPGLAFAPAGLLAMGDATNDHPTGTFAQLEEVPVHTLSLDAFYIGECEVIQAEWNDVRTWALSHGYSIPCVGNGKGADHPVGNVCWYDAVRWCNARSEKEGLTPCYYTDGGQTTVYRTGDLDLPDTAVKWNVSGYRLPTEAEWEYAARGGPQWSRFAFGPTITHVRANYFSANTFTYDVSATRGCHHDYDDCEPCTSPVGSFPGNGYGLHDVAGNASEWCWDRSDGVSESCMECGGGGLTSCLNCEGTGHETCFTCNGTLIENCCDCGGYGHVDTACGDCSEGRRPCPNCSGTGSVDVTCPTCAGDRSVQCPVCYGADLDCSNCSGTGWVTCTTCGGSGVVSESCTVCEGTTTITCDTCDGTGYVSSTCVTCGGSGSLTCSDCGGQGWHDCPLCEGDGEVSCTGCEGRGELWTSDYYTVSPPSNPRGPSTGDKRIFRGGAWDSDADSCRLSKRSEAPPSESHRSRGFRLVRSTTK